MKIDDIFNYFCPTCKEIFIKEQMSKNGSVPIHVQGKKKCEGSYKQGIIKKK